MDQVIIKLLIYNENFKIKKINSYEIFLVTILDISTSTPTSIKTLTLTATSYTYA